MKTRLVSGLAGLIVAAASASGDEPWMVRLAEGYSSGDDHTGIVAAQRLFSVPTFADECARHAAPARLVTVSPQPVQLIRGQWFRYAQLVVLATDSSGRLLPSVPIAVDVEDVAPELLDLSSDATADPDGRLFALRTGRFQFRVRTICEGHAAEAIIQAAVVEPPRSGESMRHPMRVSPLPRFSPGAPASGDTADRFAQRDPRNPGQREHRALGRRNEVQDPAGGV